METINPFDILKNARKIQDQMGDFQARLAQLRITGSSGGGMVEIDLNGRMEALAVRIDAEALENREALEDLVQVAINAGMEKVREAMGTELGSLAGGLGLGGVNPGWLAGLGFGGAPGSN